MRLIVQRQDASGAQQFLADPLDHHALGFQRGNWAVSTADHLLGEFRRLHRLPLAEGVVVGDDDPGALQPIPEFQRNDIVQDVGVVRVGRQQNAQPVADGDTGGDDQEAVGEAG
jgi:hypothetical protein